MAQNRNSSKEMFVVNFREIPETICVETRFITRAGAQQKKDQTLYYMYVNNGQVELSKYEVTPSNAAAITTQVKNIPTMRNKQPVVTVSVRNKPVLNSPAPVTVTSVMPSLTLLKPPQYVTTPIVGGQTVITQQPLGLSMSAPYNVTMLPPDVATNVCTVTTPLSTMTIPLANPILPNKNYNTPTFMTATPVSMQNSACLMGSKPTFVHREQQTDSTPVLVSTAVQCSIDDDFLDELVGDSCESVPTITAQTNKEEDKDKFLKFVKDNSVEYKNNLRECLICGEVCKSSKYFYGHMMVHLGPKVLCFLCGHYLDHEALLKTHNCIKTPKRIARAMLRCPFKQCRTIAVSRLELYDHINEHKKYRVHKCSACQKSFCTTQEFLRHLLLRANCYTEAKRDRNDLYCLKSKADRRCRVRVFTLHTHKKRTAMVKRLLTAQRRNSKKSLCEICFRSYRNKFIFKRHIKKCATSFEKRQARRKSQSKQLCNAKKL